LKVKEKQIDTKKHWKFMLENHFLGKHHFDLFNKEGKMTELGVCVQIRELLEVEISHKGRKETKPALYFRDKGVLPLLMGREKFQQLENILGSPEPHDWQGKHVYVYVDETVTFGKTAIGGIRFRPCVDVPIKKRKFDPSKLNNAAQHVFQYGIDSFLELRDATPEQIALIEQAVEKLRTS